MQISQDTEKVIHFLTGYSDDNLRKTNDLAIILELSATYDLFDEFNSLTFDSKSFWNMHKTLKNSNANQEYLSNIRNEIEKLHQKILDLIKSIIGLADDIKIKERFELNYFRQTTGNFLNLIDLAHDLAIFKNLQIDLKHSKG